MFDLLISPPSYGYTQDAHNEAPLALLKLSTYLKSQGSEVELFDFGPPFLGRGATEMTEEYNGMKLRRKRRMDIEVYNYKGQKYPLKEYSLVRKTGEYVVRFDTMCERYYVGADKNVFIEFLQRRRPDRIWVSSGLTYHYKGTAECIDWCKEVYSDVPVMLGGIYPTLCYEHALKHTKADYVHAGNAVWHDCKLDWDILPNTPVSQVRRLTHGCPNGCRFCAVGYMSGTKVVFVDVDRDIAEIKEFAEKFKCYNIRVLGDNLLIPERGKLWEKWLDGVAALPWKFNISVAGGGFAPELLTQEVCNKIRRAGITEMNVPLESAGMLSTMHKKYNVDVWKRAVGYAHNAGFTDKQLHVSVIPGLPGQSVEELKNTMRLGLEEGAYMLCNIFTPVPKSALYEESDLFKNMDLEMLAPQLMPAAHTRTQWDEIKEIMEICMSDSFTKQKELLKKEDVMGENSGKSNAGPSRETILIKMATLLADIAEQNQTIIMLLDKIISEKATEKAEKDAQAPVNV